MPEVEAQEELQGPLSTQRGNDYLSTLSVVGSGPGVQSHLPTPFPVGGRLHHFWRKWEQLGLDPWAVNVLRDGYYISFHTNPPLTTVPLVKTESKDPHKQALLAQEIQTLLDKGAIEPVKDSSTPGFYSRIFLVPKPEGKWRPVIDLSALNKFVNIPRFKMDTPAKIRMSMVKGNWVYSLDLKDAYFQVPIHKSSRKFLRLEFQGQIFQFRALPFGLSTAPWLFTKIVRGVKELFHRERFSLFQYLDDWMGDARKELEAQARSRALVHCCTELGFEINFEKSELIPTQHFDFLGSHYNLELGIVSITQKNLKKVLLAARSFVQLQTASAKKWQSVIGTLGAQDQLIPFGRFHVRPLQVCLHQHWRQGRDPETSLVPLSQEVVAALEWWSVQSNLTTGVPLAFPPFSLRIYSDASLEGWGAHCNNCLYQGTWSQEEKQLHINQLEMRAVRLALLAIDPSPNEVVLAVTDNTTVVAYINHQGGTRSEFLWQETKLLFQLIIAKRFTLRARHIAGKLNVIADQLSRAGQIIPTEWSLHPNIVQMVFHKWGTPNLDLFATRHNNQLPVYVSPCPDPLAWEVDALSLSWEGMFAYAYPPTQILTQVLKKFLETKRCVLLLVAPYWPNQLWFPKLKELADQDPLALPAIQKMLKQPRSSIFHHDPQFLKLHAWRLQRKP